ncbi:ANTAR domain-containing protein [Asanoa ferruginea]|uniref:ANTAR domain-containing protein n=1 Tax=Asanoa ferruginea TaxID=53367 RepID=A0A3D9ZFM3_9ACTN|nr:GAF and ANTAR domain-containing protein [Asanoa ferruginea]REF94633.1 ANTAR domain-containing protein [Asanoa ferruginea]GIF50825.1 GAF domain-containing protein [Asanoa ferruginea]
MSAAAGRWARAHELIAEQPGPDDRPGNVADRLRRICGAGATALTASGVGVSVVTGDGDWGFAIASNPVSQLLEELQFTLGEGPCVDAMATRRPVLVADMTGAAADRWPIYSSALREQGVRSVFAFPLLAGSASVGVLDVFRGRAGAMNEEEVAQSLTFAEIARITVLDGQHDAPVDEVPDGFDESPGYRAEVFQAQGMVMVQLGVSLAEALLRLRAHAYGNGRPLADVARDVVARTLRFDQEHP